jgi:hypothetical protein
MIEDDCAALTRRAEAKATACFVEEVKAVVYE